MKVFLNRLLYFLPIPIVIISVNYLVDPGNLFNNKYELGIVNYLVKGINVTDIYMGYDDRLLQRMFIEKMNKCPTEIALGTSRIMQLNSTHLKSTGFINNGVPYGSLEDALAIYYLYEKKGCKLQKIILELEPSNLSDDYDRSRWMTLSHEYNIFFNKISRNITAKIPKSINRDLEDSKELISYSYFQTSLKYIIKGIDNDYRPTYNPVNSGITRRTDGALNESALKRNASQAAIEEKAKKLIAENPKTLFGNFTDRIPENPILVLANFTHLSEYYKTMFSNFVDYLQKQNIEVELYLSPFHPIVYDYFKKNSYYHVVFEAEAFFRNYAKSHKIKVYGSYDPARYNFDNSYFLDGVHCNEKAIEIIVNNPDTKY